MPTTPLMTLRPFFGGCVMRRKMAIRLAFKRTSPINDEHVWKRISKALRWQPIRLCFPLTALPTGRAGHFLMMFPTLQSVMPHIKAGKLRVLAVTGEKPAPVLPGVPTMAEAGAPGVVAVAWFGVHGPAAIPAAIKSRVHAEIVRTLQDPTVRGRFTNEGAARAYLKINGQWRDHLLFGIFKAD